MATSLRPSRAVHDIRHTVNISQHAKKAVIFNAVKYCIEYDICRN